MSGRLIAAPQRHTCEPPDPFGKPDDWYFDVVPSADPTMRVPRLKPGVRLPREGDIYECECGASWVLHCGVRRGRMVIMREWQREGFLARLRRRWRERSL